MTELERRALLGDRQAQEECTRQGILLPCPFCGGKAVVFYDSNCELFGVRCRNPKCSGFDMKADYNTSRRAAVAGWNFRPEPPVGRCGECANQHSSEFCECRDEEDFCSDFAPKEGEENG